MNNTQIDESRYACFVASRTKNPLLIRSLIADSDNECMSILHAAIGINTEAGELLDAIKKAFIYGQTINVENVIEELGDLEFYIQMIRNAMQINRGEVLEANVKKLELRYPLKYTDECAKERADKQGSEK